MVAVLVQQLSVLNGGHDKIVLVVATQSEYEHVCESKVHVPEGPGPERVVMYVGQVRGFLPVMVLTP